MTLGARLASLIPGQSALLAPLDAPSEPNLAARRHGASLADAAVQTGTLAMPRAAAFEHEDEDESARRPPFLHCMLAGGIGGTTGDMLMHSLDTVKTRQQGDPHIPPKYTTLSSSYATILRQEGVGRGLYSGVTPAFLGSFPGTIIFFGTYEWSKRNLLDYGCNATAAYLAGGLVADLAASVVYVPSEVLKTRLQLQGRYNNPHFHSGYNYRSTLDAFRTIVRSEGAGALFYGYKATLFRDLPFSALQFAFYEQEQALARQWAGSRDIGLGMEVLTATTAGGLAGVLTCPLDVVKTRIQTQVNDTSASSASGHTQQQQQQQSGKHVSAPRGDAIKGGPSARHISTSSPSTSTSTAPKFNTSSVVTGLRLLYRSEGVAGWFRGVGPRGVWTSVQSGTMLVCYQLILRKLEQFGNGEDGGPAVA